jgi:hypothetical protein
MKASSVLVAMLMDAGVRPVDMDTKHTVSLNFIDLLHILRTEIDPISYDN